MSAQIHPSKSRLIEPFQFTSQYENPSAGTFQRIPCSPPSLLSHDERLLIQAFSELRCSALQDPNLQLSHDTFHRPYPEEASLSTVKTDDCAQADFEHSTCTLYHRTGKPVSDYSDVGQSGPRYRRSVTSRNVLIKPRPKTPEKRLAHSYVLARQVRERHGANATDLLRPETQAPIADLPNSQIIRHLPSACPDPDVECHNGDVHKHLAALQITTNPADGLIKPGNTNAPSALSASCLKLAPSSPRTFSEDAFQRDKDNCYTGNQTTGFSPHLKHRNPRQYPSAVSGSNKLVKRHSTKRTAEGFLPFPASALSNLSPVPLSSIAIANAKLRLQPATPVSLSEYLTGIQYGHRVSIEESMTDALPARRSKSFKFPVRINNFAAHDFVLTHLI